MSTLETEEREKIEMLNRLPASLRRGLHQDIVKLSDALQQEKKQTADLREGLSKLKTQLDALTKQPWGTAYFLRYVSEEDQWAEVVCGNMTVVVGIDPSIDATGLVMGDPVYLSAERNVILQKGQSDFRGGQTALVCRMLEPGRVLVRDRENEICLTLGRDLAAVTLKEGDTLLYDTQSGIAHRKLETAQVSGVDEYLKEYRTEPVAFVGYEDISQDQITTFKLQFLHPEQAKAYGLNEQPGPLLLSGAPGLGKTLFARTLAYELDVPLLAINASSFYSAYVGETESNIRQSFQRAQELADIHGGCILFLDEVDAVGRTRGGSHSHHQDRFLSQLLASMEGAGGRPGFAIIGACNRPDLLDPALASRMAMKITLSAPKRAAIEKIAGVHFHENRFYRDDTARQQCIKTVVNLITAPNGHNKIATIRFRDGKTQTVTAAQMISGRVLEQIANATAHRAFNRSMLEKDSPQGITPHDVEFSVQQQMETFRSTLSLSNVRDHLDLPEEADVVAVEKIEPTLHFEYLQEAVG